MAVLGAFAGLALAVAAIPQSSGPLVVDGVADEALWRQAQVLPLRAAGFGAPFPEGGEARIVVRGQYVCVAARVPEPDRVVALSVGRDPEFWPEDLVVWRFGVYTGGRNRTVTLTVNPFGGYRLDGAGGNRAQATARIGKGEWSVEAAIPMENLSRIGFLGVERIRAARPQAPELRWHWPEVTVPSEYQFPEAAKDVGPPEFRPVEVGNAEPAIEAPKMSRLPALAAGWNDPGWSGSAQVELVRDEASPRLPQHRTEVRLAHDGATLALLARCDGAETADEMQLYLTATGSEYAQFSLNPAGVAQDAKGNGPSVREPDPEAWDSSARTRVVRDGAAWVARWNLPLAELAPAGPRQWRILIRRVRRGEVSTMPVIQTATPRCPARYRRLVLVEKASSGATAARATEGLAPPVWSNPDRLMVEKNLRVRMAEAALRERRDWEQVRTPADWEQFREKRLAALRDSLGPFPERTPLRSVVTRRTDLGEGFVIENLVFESRPHLLVTANLYLPARISGRLPALVLVQSHQGPKYQPDLQDMAMTWARAGVAVLVMDQLGAGERIQSQPWPRESNYYSRYALGNQLYLAGESLIKWIVWDLMRGVDLLLERPYVDPQRIVILGSVAGGGDPAAVTAALDGRVAAVAPFNFGEAGPEEHYLGRPRGYDVETAYPGWGSWESTRCLRRSVADQFFPWFICASVAPRRFLYSFEMAWPKGVEQQPPWPRYRKVFELQGKPEHLDHVDGFGPFPGPGESNVGAYQRKRMHPILKRWLDFPVPDQEWHNPRPAVELMALTPAVAAERRPKPASEIALALARERLAARSRGNLRDALRAKLGDIDPNPAAKAAPVWSKDRVEAIAIETDPGIQVPVLLLKPKGGAAAPAVLALTQGGKERFLRDRARQIESLLARGVAVCLADVRGVGETARDPAVRGPGAMSWAAVELMLGNTMLGAQLKDARSVVRYLARRPDVDPKRIALWGDSFAEVNPQQLLVDESLNMPAGPQIQHQAEPLGPLLALLTAFYEDAVRAVATRRGLESYLSVLYDRFCYMPQDVVVPGVLQAGDVPDVVAALAPRPVLLAEQVDGRNRLVDPASRGRADPAAWLLEQVRRF